MKAKAAAEEAVAYLGGRRAPSAGAQNKLNRMGLGFRVLGFRVKGLGFRVLGFRVKGLGFRA